MDAGGTIVFLEGFSREVINRDCDHGAFEAWGRDAPGTMGTAPAGKVVPSTQINRLFIHLPRLWLHWDLSSGGEGGTHQ